MSLNMMRQLSQVYSSNPIKLIDANGNVVEVNKYDDARNLINQGYRVSGEAGSGYATYDQVKQHLGDLGATAENQFRNTNASAELRDLANKEGNPGLILNQDWIDLQNAKKQAQGFFDNEIGKQNNDYRDTYAKLASGIEGVKNNYLNNATNQISNVYNQLGETNKNQGMSNFNTYKQMASMAGRNNSTDANYVNNMGNYYNALNAAKANQNRLSNMSDAGAQNEKYQNIYTQMQNQANSNNATALNKVNLSNQNLKNKLAMTNWQGANNG